MAWKKVQVQTATEARVGSGSGQEVLGTDIGSGDSGAVCGPGAASVVQEGGRAARPRRDLLGCGALNVPFMQPWDRVPFKAGWRHLGRLPHTRTRTVCPFLPCCPEPTFPGPTLPPTPSLPLLHPTLSLCCSPASLDAFVFSYLALLQQAKLPSGKLQAHLRGLHNLCAYCTHILSLYFPWEGGKGQMGGGWALALQRVGRDQKPAPRPTFLPCPSAEVPPPRQTPANPETEEEPYRRRNQILSVLAGLAAMAGYALLSGIVSIHRAPPARAPRTRALGMAEEVEEE